MTVYIPYMTVLYMVYNPQQTCEAGAIIITSKGRLVWKVNYGEYSCILSMAIRTCSIVQTIRDVKRLY